MPVFGSLGHPLMLSTGEDVEKVIPLNQPWLVIMSVQKS